MEGIVGWLACELAASTRGCTAGNEWIPQQPREWDSDERLGWTYP
jgi:hypothetical protein